MSRSSPQVLSFLLYYVNEAVDFFTPATLSADVSARPNQQLRVDIMDPSAPVDSVAPGDVLATVYRTEPGDPRVLRPTLITFDLSQLPPRYRTVRLRFAEVDTEFSFRASVDDVRVSETAPAPPGVISVDIDIDPGKDPNTVNAKKKGHVRVAVLSTPSFDAPGTVDAGSLTFGWSGDEPSVSSCRNKPKDVNGDGLADLVCDFDTQASRLQPGDTEGVLKGSTISSTPIEGVDSVVVTSGGSGK